ncbi:hypothetical protein M0802_005234 [Mischocyttarus mexicanus]|nr:hypothetical protein M0802_005234 [Mischocyttarus mexicanus]
MVTLILAKDRVILERVLRRLCINVCPDICKQALPVSPCRDVTIHYPLAAGLNVSRPQGLRTSFGKVTVPTLFALCCWCFLKGKEKFDVYSTSTKQHVEIGNIWFSNDNSISTGILPSQESSEPTGQGSLERGISLSRAIRRLLYAVKLPFSKATEKGSGWEPIFPRGRNKVDGEKLRRESSLCPVSRRAAAGVVVASHEGAWDGVGFLLYTRRGSDLRDQ